MSTNDDIYVMSSFRDMWVDSHEARSAHWCEPTPALPNRRQDFRDVNLPTVR